MSPIIFDTQEKTHRKSLVKFIGAEHQDQPQGINFTLIDYLELVDWTGRVMREDKLGVISIQTPALLNTLGLDRATWLSLASDFGKAYQGAAGTLGELALFAEHTGKQWISGKNKLRRMSTILH